MKASEQARKDTSPRKINVTSKSPVGDISVVTLIRTDTTLDHSQKVEKACHTGCSVLHSVKTWWLQIFRTLKQVTLWIGLPQSTFQLPKLVKSHCCVPSAECFIGPCILSFVHQLLTHSCTTRRKTFISHWQLCIDSNWSATDDYCLCVAFDCSAQV